MGIELSTTRYDYNQIHIFSSVFSVNTRVITLKLELNNAAKEVIYSHQKSVLRVNLVEL